MDNSVCKICGSSKLTTVAHTARCGDCGVLLYWPYPKTDEELLREEGKPFPGKGARDWYSRSSFYNHTNFTNMLRFTLDDSFKDRTIDILDYGGGAGQFALVCRSHFLDATIYITDISDAALLDEFRPLNTQIPFAQFADDRTTFDAIFLNDVFEHVSDPVFVLKQLAGKLKPDGRIFIDTPRQFWIYPATRLLAKRLHTKVLNGTVSPAHLQIWTKPAFELVVRKAGLAIARYEEAGEYTMPADYYVHHMGLQSPLTRRAARLFYSQAKYIARNKILCVLTPGRV